MDDADLARDAGAIAAAQGRPRSDNPHPEESDLHGEWGSGYDNYEEVDEDGELKDD